MMMVYYVKKSVFWFQQELSQEKKELGMHLHVLDALVVQEMDSQDQKK